MSNGPQGDDVLVVLFKNNAKENPSRSIKEGRPIFDDQEVCEIRFPGSRNVYVFPAHSVSHWVIDQFTGGQHKITYAERFRKQYEQFKVHAEQTQSGTPLQYAPFLTEARRAELRAQNIYTVEALAHIDGQELKNLGYNGRELKNQAQAYIDQGMSRGVDASLMAELEQLRAKNAVLEEDKATLLSKVMAQSPNKDADFSSMSDQQLAEYIAQKSGHAIQGQLNRKTMLRMAQDLQAQNKAA